VPLRRVHIRRPWRGTPAVVGSGAVGNHGGIAGGVATAVSTTVVVLAATTAVAAVVVPILIVVAVVTVAGAAAVVLARRARQCQRRRQWSGQRFVGLERRRSSSWTGGVQVDFLHHGIRLDVEVGDNGIDVQ
jgi:Flp pilus assembly protein TadB